MIVLSLGGSLINPGTIDVSYLKRFREFILGGDDKFIVVCGGGALARQYMSASRAVRPSMAPDWFGIEATCMNAGLVRALFSPRGSVFREPRKVRFSKVLCACGWKPGFTSDGDAVLWAVKNGVDTVFNLTDVDYVYDKDPKYRSARPLKELSWRAYLALFGDYSPGMHAPFDPVASRIARKNKVRVVILDGRKLNNLRRAIDGEDFVGTVIS